MGGQLKGKVVIGVTVAIEVAIRAVIAIGKEAIKEDEGEIWDEEALDALFNEIIQYLVVNSYVSIITKFYI